MKKKLLTCLTLLLCVCSGAWADDDPSFELMFQRVNKESAADGYSRLIKEYPSQGITLKGYGDLDSGNPKETTAFASTGNITISGTATPHFCHQFGGGANALHRISFLISSTKKITKVSYLICTNQSSASTVQPVLMGWEGDVSTTVDYYSLYPSGTTIDSTPDNAEWITFDLSGSGKNLKTVELYRSISKNVFTYNESKLAAAGGDKTLRLWGIRIWTQDASVAPTTPTIGIDEGNVDGNTDLTISSTNAENIYYYWSDNSSAPEKGNAAYSAAAGSSYETKVPNVTATKYLHTYGFNDVGTSDIATFTFNVTKVQEEAGLSYATASLSKAKGADAFTNTLTNPNSLTVTYSITNNGSGSTINATTGEVTVGSNYGIETITATSEATQDFFAGVASYSLVVEAETSDIVAISPEYTFIADNITSSGTVGLTAKCLYDGNHIFSLLGNTAAKNKGQSTINGTKYYNSLRVKSSSQDVLVFKVDRPCAITIYAQTTGKTGDEARPIKVGTAVNDNTYGSIPDSDPADGDHTVTIMSAGLVYLTGTGDRFIAGFDVKEVTRTVTIASSGWSSYSSDLPLDFANATDSENGKTLKAYTLSSLTKSTATLTSVENAPASTGLILKGKANETYTIPVCAAPAEVGTNKLVACIAAATVDANSVYVVSGGGLKLFTGTDIPANKAYMPKTEVDNAAEAKVISFVFDGETTGIKTLDNFTNSPFDNDAPMYNLAGQRVGKNYKGVVIQNGKKIIIK